MQFDQTIRANELAPRYAGQAANLTGATEAIPKSAMGGACDSFSGRMEQLEVLVSELERKFGPVLRAVPPSPEGQRNLKEGNVSSVTSMIQLWDARADEVLRRLSQLMDRVDL